jgi:hypothetical protein
MFSQQKKQFAGPWKLGRIAEAAAPRVERRSELLDASSRAPGSGTGRPPLSRPSSRKRSVIDSADVSIRARSSSHARAISLRMSMKPGLPHLDAGGK